MDFRNKKEEKIKLIEEFYREYGRLPKQAEKYKEVAIGAFLSSIKSGGTKITEEQMNRLLILGFEGQINDVRVDRSIFQIGQFYRRYQRLPEPGESFRRERNKVGDMLLSIRVGKIRITEAQFLRLQQMDVTLTREQVRFIEKPKTLIKK